MTSAIREFFKAFIERNGSSISIYPVTTTTYSTYYNDATITYGTAVSSYGLLVYGLTDLVKSVEGELQRESFKMFIPYDQTVANKYKIVLDSVNYEVVGIQTYPYKGTSVAYLVELSRMVST